MVAVSGALDINWTDGLQVDSGRHLLPLLGRLGARSHFRHYSIHFPKRSGIIVSAEACLGRGASWHASCFRTSHVALLRGAQREWPEGESTSNQL